MPETPATILRPVSKLIGNRGQEFCNTVIAIRAAAETRFIDEKEDGERPGGLAPRAQLADRAISAARTVIGGMEKSAVSLC